MTLPGPATSKHTIPEYLTFLWSKPYVRLLVYLALGWLLLNMAKQLAGVLVMIAAAYAISYVVNPLILWLESKGLRRSWSVLLLLLGFLGITGLLFWTLASQVTSFISGLPHLLERFPDLLEKTFKDQTDVPAIKQMQGKLVTYVRERIAEISGNIGPITAQMLNPNSDLMGRLAGVLGWLGQASFVVTLAVFFMLDHAKPGRMLLGLLPKLWQSTAVRLADDVSVSFGGYIRGSLLTGVAISVIAGVGLLILKVPNALALGLLTGILNLIPMIGMVLATIPVLLQAIPQGTFTLIAVCVLYFILNQIAWNVIAPMIMGRTAKISPAGILIAVLIGGAVGGLGGAFLAIPAAMLLQLWVGRYWLHSPAHEGLSPRIGWGGKLDSHAQNASAQNVSVQNVSGTKSPGYK